MATRMLAPAQQVEQPEEEPTQTQDALMDDEQRRHEDAYYGHFIVGLLSISEASSRSVNYLNQIFNVFILLENLIQYERFSSIHLMYMPEAGSYHRVI